MAQKQIESEIRYYLKNKTLTFGANDAVELEKIVFDWPDYWEQNQAPSFLVVVRSLDPKLPSYKQVQNIQDTINSRLSRQFPGLELQMQVQRTNVSVVEGNEVDLAVDLEQIFNEADTSEAPPKALEDEPKVQAEDGIRDQPRSRGLGDVYKRQIWESPWRQVPSRPTPRSTPAP